MAMFSLGAVENAARVAIGAAGRLWQIFPTV